MQEAAARANLMITKALTVKRQRYLLLVKEDVYCDYRLCPLRVTTGSQ